MSGAYERPDLNTVPEKRDLALDLLSHLSGRLPPGVGAALLLTFDYGQGGGLGWVSTGPREDMLVLLFEWLEHQPPEQLRAARERFAVEQLQRRNPEWSLFTMVIQERDDARAELAAIEAVIRETCPLNNNEGYEEDDAADHPGVVMYRCIGEDGDPVIEAISRAEAVRAMADAWDRTHAWGVRHEQRADTLQRQLEAVMRGPDAPGP
jgi:hypothetical protein